MAEPKHWVEAARPRTLFAAVAPVAVGTGAAAGVHSAVWWKALLALVVSLALQIGVNYANDYSDGIRGTDTNRVGPLRLVGSGLASPRSVRAVAFGFFSLAAAAGLALAATSSWWLLVVGAAAVVAAWGYTGGPLPYGYRALGEVAVFTFFGLVAVLGTTYAQSHRFTVPADNGAVAVGLLACAILVANNLRDIASDAASGKRTLAVLMGERLSRRLYVFLVAAPFGIALGLSVSGWPAAALALVAAPLALRPARLVLAGTAGLRLIPVLRDTGLLELAFSLALAIGIALR
ncbi:MAG: 1,4-dihydroxy-2-naphthoate polyprenyltransferase [Mycobacteriales bacterium]